MEAKSELVEIARALAPTLRQHRARAESERRLPKEVAHAMADAGLFQMWLPKALGGSQVDVTTFVRVIEEISRIDSAAGWCLSVGAMYSRLGGYLREDVARTIYAGPRSMVAGVINPAGRATRVDGGYRIDGRWSFGSGIHYSPWVFGNCIVFENGKPKTASGGPPEILSMFFPQSDCEILDTWHVGGLRGTGSTDYAVKDLFIPAERAIGGFGAPPTQPGALYKLPLLTLFAACIAAVPLGIARSAIESLVQIASEKTPTGAQQLLRERPTIQVAVARAEALLRSSRAYLFETIEEIWYSVEQGGEVTTALRGAVRLASANVAMSCGQAVDLMYDAGGASSFRESCPLERHFRDVHAAVQHITVVAHNYELAGRILLGMPPLNPNF